MRDLKLTVVVEHHKAGYFVAYPLGGIEGGVVGEGGTLEEAVKDLRSAIRAHVDHFGSRALDENYHLVEADLVELRVRVNVDTHEPVAS